jgi:hypothetical protein
MVAVKRPVRGNRKFGGGVPHRWAVKKAWRWAERLPWLVGCNFIPSTAINQLEMWQAETFDTRVIDRELALAESLGFNIVRVYLHDLLWESDWPGFRRRIHAFLHLAMRHRLHVLFVIFDDCWNDGPKAGRQPVPVPGVHNSGWMRSPGSAATLDPRQWRRLEQYVTELLETFRDDERIVLWDIYNEPGNSKMGDQSLPLLREVFRWARKVDPSQPLTAGMWFDNAALNDFQIHASDVITFHHYNDVESLQAEVARLKLTRRPVICTEYMRRPISLFSTHLPLLKEAGVGAINWGLVAGKTQTIYPWGSPAGAPPPDPWFHDIFKGDGSPYLPEEIAVIRQQTFSGEPRLR